MNTFPFAQIERLYTWEEYWALSQELFAQNRTTSDDPHYNSDDILAYTKVNLARMKRLAAHTELDPELVAAVKALKPQTWVVFTESWCGDAAQIVPILAQLAAQNPSLTFRLALRDRNPDAMNLYLTNGGKSIPKLVAIEAQTDRVLGTWGPRPVPLQDQMMAWKAEGIPFAELLERVQRWYHEDKTHTLQTELQSWLASLQ